LIRRLKWGWLVVALAVPLAAAGTGGAAIAPPWCGTPMPDAAEALPDGTDPSDPPGSFPHIPYYAIGCTLDSIAAQSGGRMKVEVIGQSALGRDMFLVTINELGTQSQRRDYANWRLLDALSRSRPGLAQRLLDQMDGRVKVPLMVQGGIHGNEFEAVDSAMQLIERLATTPYGSDPEVDQILDHSIVLVNVIQNPDGRIVGLRQNGNGFDLNRDYLTQAQPETKASVAVIQKWQPPELLDLHGYVTPTLIEATTKPHNPSIEYDLWLKWNQARIDANEAAMNAEEFQVTRPINDWCADGSGAPSPVTGLCDDDTTNFGPAWAEGWDDWGPFYTPMYAQHVGLNGSTVEMCNQTAPVAGTSPPRTACGPPVSDNSKVGRLGARLAQYVTSWSTLLYDTENRSDLLRDELEFYRRGAVDAPRPACCPPPFDVANNWMHEYPQAYVIPFGGRQRSDPEANRLVEWLLFNGAEVERLEKKYRYAGQTLERGTYVVRMDQTRRGLIDTALGIGQDISQDIAILYAPPASWSHGYLWGADVITVPDADRFRADTERIRRPNGLDGGTAEGNKPVGYALELDSPTAIRVANTLIRGGLAVELATASFSTKSGGQAGAGSLIFPASAAGQLEDVGEEAGLWFHPIKGTLPPRETIDRVPRIAVIVTQPAQAGSPAPGVDQSVWTLRNLGFDADPYRVVNLNDAPTDPLPGYDLVFSASNWPASPPNPPSPIAQARLANYLAQGGGFIAVGTGGAAMLNQIQATPGLTAASNSGGGAGYSGIINWNNSGGAGSVITGAYRATDTAIVDPPTWFTSLPGTMTADGSLPLTGFFLSGLAPFDWTAAGAPGSAVVAHGTIPAGTARLAAFAMNPLYRADPEREWPMLASAAYWADQ
jgi:Zinc carboxypeptidase